MLSRNVKDYIAAHSFCSEYLFRDWEGFLDLLYAEGGRVWGVLFWDHCEQAGQRESLGSGGYRDPERPGYMYAETQIFEDGLKTRTPAEVKAYIRSVIAAHPGHDLVPSFYLDE